MELSRQNGLGSRNVWEVLAFGRGLLSTAPASKDVLSDLRHVG
jgi:hypothetical protein